jgi:hypothetical protein
MESRRLKRRVSSSESGIGPANGSGPNNEDEMVDPRSFTSGRASLAPRYVSRVWVSCGTSDEDAWGEKTWALDELKTRWAAWTCALRIAYAWGIATLGPTRQMSSRYANKRASGA